MNIENFVQSLQASIAPCIFISGLGLLLLSMTNRLGRTIDRMRVFNVALKDAERNEIPLIREQAGILYRRSRFLQIAIGFILASIFFVSLIMLMLFSTLALNIKFISAIKLFFTASLLSLIASLIFFFWDICLTLSSIRVEIEKGCPGDAGGKPYC